MADNTSIDPGTTPSVPVATDEIATFHYQKIKIYDGTLDSTNGLVVSAAGAAKVDGSAVTQPVSVATIPSHAVTNAGTFAVQADTELPAAAALADTTANPTIPSVAALGLLFNGTTWDRVRGDITNGVDVDVTRLPALVAGAAVIGALTANQSVNVAQINGVTTLMGAGNTGTGSQRVTIATDQADVSVKPNHAATANLTNVAASAASVTVLAGNTARKGCIVVNDSTAGVYLKFGSAASATSYTYRLEAKQTFESPAGVTYDGIITGIWDSATGNARVTELLT